MTQKKLNGDLRKLIDEILSKTQRKTPTIIRKTLPIGRIRRFYIRKVTFFQTILLKFFDKLKSNLPFLDKIHPFYKNQISIILGKNNYKATIYRVDKLIKNANEIVKSYVKMIKHADNFFACKQLKKSAFGRICKRLKQDSFCFNIAEKMNTIKKKIGIIDPFRKTLIILGCAYVGKTSLLSKITTVNSNLEKRNRYCLYSIGHLNFNFYRWQIVDTPFFSKRRGGNFGISEIQVLNFLVHVDGNCLFIMDLADLKGSNFFNQCKVLETILKITHRKRISVCFNKTDLGWERTIGPMEKSFLSQMIFKPERNNFYSKLSLHDGVGLCQIKDELLSIHQGLGKVANFNSEPQYIMDGSKEYFENRISKVKYLNKVQKKKLLREKENRYSGYLDCGVFIGDNSNRSVFINKLSAFGNNNQAVKSALIDENEDKIREFSLEKKAIFHIGKKNEFGFKKYTKKKRVSSLFYFKYASAI